MNILPAPELLALAGARRAIDHVDDALLLLLAARRRIVGALAPIKRNCGETARNPDRETQVHARAQRLARKLNVPDVMQRVHWDPQFAARTGNPTTYDYGRMRETWLLHLCTDWMGDDAWLWKLECEFRSFNYVGDTQWITGEVTRKYLAEGDRPAVDIDLRATNQRGDVTTPGKATILLPSREHGEVRLPEPPGGATDLAAALEAIVVQFRDR